MCLGAFELLYLFWMLKLLDGLHTSHYTTRKILCLEWTFSDQFVKLIHLFLRRLQNVLSVIFSVAL